MKSLTKRFTIINPQTLSKLESSKIKTWVGRCDCWKHSDDLSKIYAKVVEDNSALLLPQLRKWNISSSPWQRRQSVGSLIEYASKRKEILPFETLISFVAPLFSDQDYYVLVYPTAALGFIYANLSSLTPIAFSTATEKVNKPDKTKMKEERKKLR